MFFLCLLHIKLQSVSSLEPNGGREKSVGASQIVFLFIVLTVGLENHLKSKQITVYWAVKAPFSQCNNVLADKI